MVNYLNKLFQQRDIYEEAKLYKEKQENILPHLEGEDKQLVKIEAGSKVFYNTMTMAATILLFSGGAFLSSPTWMLGIGMGIFGASFLAQTIGTIIETNRNQSQSDSIARALHNKLKKGIPIGNLEGKKKFSSHNPNNISNTSTDTTKVGKTEDQKDIFNELVSAKTHKELDSALEKIIKQIYSQGTNSKMHYCFYIRNSICCLKCWIFISIPCIRGRP